jgi:hypothetical protein
LPGRLLLNHIKVALSRTAHWTIPVVWHILPAGSGRQAFFRAGFSLVGNVVRELYQYPCREVEGIRKE